MPDLRLLQGQLNPSDVALGQPEITRQDIVLRPGAGSDLGIAPNVGATTNLELHSGVATFTAAEILAASGAKGGVGSGETLAPGVLSAVGAKVGAGEGAVIAVASLAGAGRRAGVGAGTLAVSAMGSTAGTKAGIGLAEVLLTADLAGTGEQENDGVGSLALHPILAAAGTKGEPSSGVLVLTATMAATGTARQVVLVVEGLLPTRTQRTAFVGHGRMGLVEAMAGAGEAGRSAEALMPLGVGLSAIGTAVDTDEEFLVALFDLAA